MSVGRFFCRMMAVMLCLMMQLPVLAMPAAMASGTAAGPMASMAGHAHMIGTWRYGMVPPSSLRSSPAPDPGIRPDGSGVRQAPEMGAEMRGAFLHGSSRFMARMLVRVRPVSWGMRLGDDATPCCQSHHVNCDAGLLPVGPSPVLPLGSRPAFQHYALRLSLRSSIVPPWRPPAVLPV